MFLQNKKIKVNGVKSNAMWLKYEEILVSIWTSWNNYKKTYGLISLVI